MPADSFKNSKASLLRRLISVLQPFMGSVGYFLKSNLDGLRSIWQHWIKAPSLDVGAGLFSIMALLSGLILYKAKNKNLDKTFDFLYFSLQATLAVLTMGVVGLAPPAIITIIISAMALNMVYSLGGLIYSFYKYRNYANLAEALSIRQSYKNAMFKYGLGLFISAVVLTSFLVVTVFFPYVAAAVSLSIALATSAMLLSIGIYKVYKFFSPAEQKNATSYSPEIIANGNVISKPSVRPSSFEYHYVNERLKLTGNCHQDRKTLILEAYGKILQLEKQIHCAKGGVGEIFWSQEAKRQAKLDFFNESLSFLLSTLSPQDISYADGLDEVNKINAISIVRLFKMHEAVHKQKNLHKLNNNYLSEKPQDYLEGLNSKVHQSFLRKTGETEFFIQAMKSYFKNLTAEKTSEVRTSPIIAAPPIANDVTSPQAQMRIR